MKRLALPAFVAAYAAFGICLLLQMPHPWQSISGGEMRWDPFRQKMTIHVTSRNAVINMSEIDFSRTRFIRDHPDGMILIKVTGGSPSRLIENSPAPPNGVILVNPAGVIVGPTAILEPGSSFSYSTLDIELKDFTVEPFEFFQDSSGKEIFLPELREINPSAVELKAHGNVYALALKKDGAIRANASQKEKR